MPKTTERDLMKIYLCLNQDIQATLEDKIAQSYSSSANVASYTVKQ